MYSLVIAVLGLVIFIYMFDVLRKHSSRRAKQVGLGIWLAIGLVVLGYSLVVADGDSGVMILSGMVALFWVLPTGALLYLSSKHK